MRRKSIGVFAAAAALALVPGEAQAGEYQQHFCKSGAGDPNANAWYGVGWPQPSVNCSGGGVYYNTQTLPLYGFGGLHFDAPAGARYKAVTVNLRVPYQAQNRRTYVEADGGYVFSWWNGWGGSQSWNPEGNFITYQVQGSRYVEIGQACHGSSPAGCEAGDFAFSGIAATLTDTTAPGVSLDNVGVFDTTRTVFRGAMLAQADIADYGHGPASASLKVDNVDYPGAHLDFLPSCSYRLPTPCPQRPNWDRWFDTSGYPDGTHTVKIVADDGVGQSASDERTVTFDNTAPVLDGIAPFNGETHSADAGVWEVSATDATSTVARIEYWIDSGAMKQISGGSGSIVVTGPGQHTVRVRAVDVAGNVSSEQVSTFTLAEAPTNQRITTMQDEPLPGAPGPGDEIKCDVGSPWSDGTTFTYRWLRDGAVIDGATGQSYVLVGEDSGRELVCRVSASNEAGVTERDTPPVTAGVERCFGLVGPTDPCGDFDHDGEENQVDPDDDGDGAPDGSDPAPFDPNVPGSGAGSGSGGTGASGSGSAGGSSTQVVRESAVTVVLGPPNNGANASNRARITVEGSRKRTVKFGRRIATVAHLRDENGRPITGAQVTVLERMNVAGAEWVPARAPLVSDSRGRLRWIIPAKYSRTIRYAYKANLANTDFQSTSDVVLTVFSKSTLKPSRTVARNGQTVAFRGKLQSRPIPPGGVLIDLQAKVGTRWQTFKTTRARGAGRWAVRYRFTSTSGVRTYVFRARVRQDSGYPYAMTKTRSVRVKVIG